MISETTHSALRSRPDRFLIGILVGLVALLVLAGIAVALAHQPAALPVGTPGATVQQFYQLRQEAGTWRISALPPGYLPYP